MKKQHAISLAAQTHTRKILLQKHNPARHALPLWPSVRTLHTTPIRSHKPPSAGSAAIGTKSGPLNPCAPVTDWSSWRPIRQRLFGDTTAYSPKGGFTLGHYDRGSYPRQTGRWLTKQKAHGRTDAILEKARVFNNAIRKDSITGHHLNPHLVDNVQNLGQMLIDSGNIELLMHFSDEYPWFSFIAGF